MNSQTCPVPGCNEPVYSLRRYEGVLYCLTHYKNLFETEVLNEYESWTLGGDPSERFRSLLGRMYEEFGSVEGDSYLSAARIRDRGFHFLKTDDGLTFFITRHPGAWKSDDMFSKIVQNWQVNLSSKSFKLIGTEAWQPGYPE